ncbi:cupredoxin domain-containing protein [Solirubrobacter ginsenosidimutans]|uniref:Cupredoxin domain-containing protein n=1 Tax=Solirubrobacter ginsenosidimutans TaxID=490573 RepID=A0A9X3MUU6_9ACTN|nr:cupredoxin domain-containing protein [Solirubrobacter ginsenosidimutans]MDA0163044.1 cupredoxin domain-containing protein [Solirubrobacter ginsenosidimutans]
MSSLTHHRRVGLLGLVAAFAAIIVAVALASTSDAASKSSKVTLSEFKISASPKTASAGKVTFNVKNAGDMEHEMVVIKTSTAASKLKVGSNNRVSEKGSVGEVEDLAGGKSKKLTLNLKKGHYVLICNIPGHYKGGMRADFTVK